MNMKMRPHISLALFAAAGFAMATVPVVCAAAEVATYDGALEDQPCGIVTADMVAQSLDVPAGDLKQSHVMSSRCAYEMKGDGDSLEVEIAVQAFDTDAQAAESFLNATRSISGAEIADAMETIKNAADEANRDTDLNQDATNSIAAGLAPNGIRFEQVNDLADQARFDTSDGTLQFQQGNLRIKLRAFHGPAMPIPDEITQETMRKTLDSWMLDTMSDRKEQAIALAAIALAAL